MTGELPLLSGLPVVVPRRVSSAEIRQLIVEMEWGTLPIDEEYGPTNAMPGSREKVEVMARRVSMGYHPHHPMDRSHPHKHKSDDE